MSSALMRAEDLNFIEDNVKEMHRKVITILVNVKNFYDLFSATGVNPLDSSSTNVLDKWIIALLDNLIIDVTKNLDNYKLLEPVRSIRDFIDSLSTWYLRRSRERIKEGDKNAKETLYCALKNLSKLMAPFAPFASEDIWQKLKTGEDVESVHLTDWPQFNKVDSTLMEKMSEVRGIVTLGLQARQKAGIPVRQPLGDIKLKNYELDKEFTKIIKEELNIKIVVIDNNIEGDLELDTHITEELKQEGNYRELVRAIQDMRKKEGLNPSDIITLVVDTNVEGQELINKWKAELMKTVIAKEIKIKENEGVEVKIDQFVFKIVIEKQCTIYTTPEVKF
jgi:isoleucyl-tRNA synthetase